MDNNGAVSALLVLGAPRSGTSVVCHALNRLGVDFGDPKFFVDPETNRHNPIFFELTDLNRLNNEILASLGIEFGDFNALLLPSDFTSTQIDQFEPRIRNFLRTHFAESTAFGLKDPRFCFTLPIWTKVLMRLGIKTRYLLTTRHADAVATSNYRLNPEKGITHARRINPMSEGAAHCFLVGLEYEVVRFDQFSAATPDACAALARSASTSVDAARAAISEVVDTALVHWLPTPADEGACIRSDPGEQYQTLVESVRRFELAPMFSEPFQGARALELPTLPLDTALATLPSRIDDGVFQVFCRPSGGPYSEQISRCSPWPARTNGATFQIDFGHPVEADYLRVDFDNYPGAFFLKTILVDGVEVLPSVAVRSGSGVILTPQLVKWVGLIVNHSDPWIELSLEAGRARVVQVDVVRLPLAEVAQRLAQAYSIETRFDDLQARLAVMDDRSVAGVVSVKNMMGDYHQEAQADLVSLVARMEQLQHHVAGLETLLDSEHMWQRRTFSEVHSDISRSLGMLQEIQVEKHKRLGARLRAWLSGQHEKSE